MKNKFAALTAGTTIIHLVILVILWNVFVDPVLPSGDTRIWIFALSYVVVMVLAGFFGSRYIVKPYMVRIKELEAAAEESQKAEQIRKEFVANVTHELKTPLTSISGFIETLQDGAAEDPEIRTKFIDIIAIETARLKRLIQDLLVLSDIENKRESELSKFHVGKAIADTVETLRPIADKKNINMVQEIDDALYIKGSVDRFRQMMVNLIENAIKYSNDDGNIWVKAVTEAGRIIVSVKDEGIGIAPEHHERLFERFYRVDKSRSKKAGGTGLGLSIVKHIAFLFGASLKVESQVGKGSTFYIVFDAEEKMNDS